jgi:hypothetical protein
MDAHKPNMLSIPFTCVRGVPKDEYVQLKNWLLPSAYVPAARNMAEIVRRPGRPVCRVCGGVMGKEIKEVLRFKFQHIGSPPKQAYLHPYICLPAGQDAPDTITEAERQVHRAALSGGYDWCLEEDDPDEAVTEYLSLLELAQMTNFVLRPPRIPSSML